MMAESRKFVIVPVAIPGSGKTTLARALLYLFPKWGHFQNDLVSGKGPKAKILNQQCVDFLANLSEDPDAGKVVIVDRNNHLLSQRNELMTDLKALFDKKQAAEGKSTSEFVYICLNFAPLTLKEKGSPANKELWDSTRKLNLNRIFDRGDSHPTIRAATKDSKKVHMIMGMFLKNFEKVDSVKEPDSRFDLILNLDTTHEDSSWRNLKTVLKALREKYGDELIREVSEKEMKEGFERALVKEEVAEVEKITIPKFEISDREHLIKSVDKLLENDTSEEAVTLKGLWEELKNDDKILKSLQCSMNRPIVDLKPKEPKRIKLEDDYVIAKKLIFDDNVITLSVQYPKSSSSLESDTSKDIGNSSLAIAMRSHENIGKELAKFRKNAKYHRHVEWLLPSSKFKCHPIS